MTPEEASITLVALAQFMIEELDKHDGEDGREFAPAGTCVTTGLVRWATAMRSQVRQIEIEVMRQAEIEIKTQIRRLPEGDRLRVLERIALDIIEPVNGSFTDQLLNMLEEFVPRGTPRTIIGIRAGLAEAIAPRVGAIELRERLTALLALPANAPVHDIAEAVRLCVRRCEALELECMNLKERIAAFRAESP